MVHSEPEELRTRCSLCDVVLLVSGNTCYVESLRIADSSLAFAIDHIVDSALVVSVKKTDMDDVLTEECLLRYLGNEIFTILADNDDLRKVRTVADELGVILLLEVDSHESLSLVGV